MSKGERTHRGSKHPSTQKKRAVAAGFADLSSFGGVAQESTLGSVFFEIAIQQASGCVLQSRGGGWVKVVGQIFCFIVDNSASTGRPILVKCAACLYSDLAADLGLMNHKSKRKVEGGRASAAALEEAGYGAERRLEFWMA